MTAALPSALGVGVPSPLDNAELWDSIGLGLFTFPAIPNMGRALVKLSSKLKTDKQQAAGKAKAKQKITGKDTVDGSIELVFHVSIWPQTEAMLTALDPNGEAGGDPQEIKHPDASRRRLKSVLIKEVGPVEWEPGGWLGKCKLDVEEWVKPAAAAVGTGTKTPDATQKWPGGGTEVVVPGGVANPAPPDGLSRATFPQDKGFNGDNAPKATPS